jgi:membrane associated rhomboid family serine protease
MTTGRLPAAAAIPNLNDLATAADMPPGVLLLIAGQSLLIAGYLFYALLFRKRKRAATPALATAERAERRVDNAMMAVIVVLLVAMMSAYAICTFEGMVALAEHQFGWHGWLKYVPWGAYDAASILFTLLAVRQVRRGRSPRKAYKAVAIATAISASLQLYQGGD